MFPVVVVRLVEGKKVVEHIQVSSTEFQDLLNKVGKGDVVEVIRLTD